MDAPPPEPSGNVSLKLFGFEYSLSWKPTPETVANNVESLCRDKLDAYKAMGKEPPSDLVDFCEEKTKEAHQSSVS
jgi:hypothetical protein